MAALVISISSDVSVESVGSSFPRVILIGSISVEVLVALEVGATVVALPVGDDSESDTEILERHVSPTNSTLEIPTTPILPAPSAIVAPSFEFPLAHVFAPPGILRIIPYPDIHHQTPLMMIHLYHKDLFIHRLLGIHDVARLIFIGDLPPLSTMSSAATVTLPIHSTRALVPSRVNLLPPRKRFRDSISPDDSIEEDIDTNVLEVIEADATTVKVAVDKDVEAGIDVGIGIEVDVGINVEDEVEDEVESRDKGTIEVGVDMDVGIDIPDGMLKLDNVEHLEQVNSLRRHMTLSQEEFCQVCKDRDDTRRRLRRLDLFVKRSFRFRP
nr:hypothetical protein [Tanacetum cinerariifolium]